MLFHRSPGMAHAARLVREGRLGEATSALQSLLRGTPPVSPAGNPTEASGRIIDIDPATGEILPPGTTSTGTTAHRTAAKPNAARFTTRTHTGPGGQRAYRLYVPATAAADPMPLVVMLHGCTQSPDDFAAGTGMNALAEAQGFLVAYPGQTKAANANKCWNWFNPADQRRDHGEPALIAGITRDIIAAHHVDPRRVYVAGLSAGGAAAAVMGAAYPELYAAVGVHSGLPCGAARDIPSAFAAMRDGGPVPRAGAPTMPTIVFHADADSTVHPRNAEHIITQSGGTTALRVSVANGQVPGGHAYTRRTYTDAAGRAMLEQWMVHGGTHAWSGGHTAGSFTDPRGPDASREMVRFFLQHRRA